MKDKKIILIAGVLIILLIGYFFFLKNTEEKVVVIPKNSDYSIYEAPKLPELEGQENGYIKPRDLKIRRYPKNEYFEIVTGLGISSIASSLKEIDVSYLIDHRYKENSEKLKEPIKIDENLYNNVTQSGINYKEVLGPANSSVALVNNCINIILENNNVFTRCNPEKNEYGKEVYGVYYKYEGYIEKLKIHTITWSIEESGFILLSQISGESIENQYNNHFFTPDFKYLFSFSDIFGSSDHDRGGLIIYKINPDGTFETLGGYDGEHEIGVKEVKISSSNELYFKTLSYVYDETQQYNRREVYSYFKQELE